MLLAIIDGLDSTIQGWFTHFRWPAEYAARLALAMIAGGLVGIERELRGRQAGFRTNILVCVGSCLTMIVSINFASRPWPHEPNVNMNIDPARIAYGVMTGIGFLGAGAIIKLNEKEQIKGLTTAATIWSTAAIGVAAGLGLAITATLATLLALVILALLPRVERHIARKNDGENPRPG